MNYPSLLIRTLLAGTACVWLSGCFSLKPAHPTARYFVLSPLPVAVAPGPTTLAVGVGQVKLPAYLFKDSLAVRKGPNEVEYLETAVWAEHLQSGFQRILAANLAALLPTDQVRLSDWRREDIALEIYVAVEQFDVDTSGRGELVTWWRILSPGGEKILKAGQFRGSHQGPPPQADPEGATATLSRLLTDLSRELALGLKAVAPGIPAGGKP
jgi:uncharacterized lipoprotein YmbA